MLVRTLTNPAPAATQNVVSFGCCARFIFHARKDRTWISKGMLLKNSPMQRATPWPEKISWLARTMHCFSNKAPGMYSRTSSWFEFKTSVNHIAEPIPFQICVDRVTSQTHVPAAGLTLDIQEDQRNTI